MSPIIISLLLSACVGSTFERTGIDPGVRGGPDSGLVDDVDPGTFVLTTLENRVETELGQRMTFEAQIESRDGFAGDVELSLADAQPDWIVTYLPGPSVSLSDGDQVQVTVHVDVPTTSASGNRLFSLGALQSNEEIENQTLELSANILNVVSVPIPDNTTGGLHAYPDTTIRLGTAIRIVNMDTTQPHRIHSAEDDAGFPHQEETMSSAPSIGAEGGEYLFTLNQTGTYDNWYCHIHEQGSGRGSIEVIE